MSKLLEQYKNFILFRGSHFKREAILMTLYPVIIFVMLVIAIVAFTIKEYLRVDRCLDAGGVYNYELQKCRIDHKDQNSST
ncbi:MAG: hypothetical protein MI976_12945 [Pseudomonadales bacterium]|nr:hypothetical protein [Pseudomonadales bacterium]